MIAYRKQSPNKLSGGQKQRVAIAGVMAMRPQCIILDEPTAMLDPTGRKDVIRTVHELNKKEGITALLITHYMEEAQSLCNRVALMDHGKLEEINTPSGLIESLGKYTVDQETSSGAKSHYFHSREEAITFLSALDGQCTLRETTLEDVFVERAGRHLMQR